MTILCPHCKQNSKDSDAGASRVMATRRQSVRLHLGSAHKRVRTYTNIRLRQCLTCRWRWKTAEITLIPVKKDT